MYSLWKERYISKPSEYWNMGLGDKLMIRAFYEKNIEERNKIRLELGRNNTPVFPTMTV